MFFDCSAIALLLRIFIASLPFVRVPFSLLSVRLIYDRCYSVDVVLVKSLVDVSQELLKQLERFFEFDEFAALRG